MARTRRIQAVAGERVTVPVDPSAWPYRIQIGDDVAPAWPQKARGRRGVETSAWRECPNLPAGEHPLVLHDAHGAHLLGNVTIVRS